MTRAGSLLVTESTPLMAKNESSPLATVIRVVSFLAMLYLFFSSIELMSAAFKMGGAGLAEQLLNTASDPVAGLLIGFLATSLIQSSSTTTTIVVGLVASDALTIQLAVPIIICRATFQTVCPRIRSGCRIVRNMSRHSTRGVP